MIFGHFVTSFQWCNYKMDIQHLVSVRVINMSQECLSERAMQLSRPGSHCIGSHCIQDTSDGMWGILSKVAVEMLCGWYSLHSFIDIIYWRRVCLFFLQWNVSQAGNNFLEDLDSPALSEQQEMALSAKPECLVLMLSVNSCVRTEWSEWIPILWEEINRPQLLLPNKTKAEKG